MLNPSRAYWMNESASSRAGSVSHFALDASLGFAPQDADGADGVFAFGLGRDAAAALAAAAASATFRLFSASCKAFFSANSFANACCSCFFLASYALTFALVSSRRTRSASAFLSFASFALAAAAARAPPCAPSPSPPSASC